MSSAPDWTGGVYVVVFRGRRYDTGDRLDYIKAIIQLAVDREDLGADLRPWLRTFVDGLDAGPAHEAVEEMTAVPAGDGAHEGR